MYTKAWFVRAWVNIDITKSLPIAIYVSLDTFSAKFCLEYEGLHELCVISGDQSQLIEIVQLRPRFLP